MHDIRQERVCEEIKHQMKQITESNNGGIMKMFVGCKVKRNNETRTLKLTQPAMFQISKTSLTWGKRA